MKTSNYILIALFAFVTASLLVLFISARGHENETGLTEKEYPVENIHTIVAEQKWSVYIHTSDKNSMSVKYPKGKKEPENYYRISNDTLYFLDTAYQNQFINLYTNHLSSLVASNANIYFRNYISDKLEINAVQAHISFQNSSIEEVVIHTNKSEVSMFSTKVESIAGKLMNDSKLRSDSKDIQKIEIEKDNSSKIDLH